MCTYFCIGFIDFMLKSRSLLECTNLFSPNEYEKIGENNFKTFSIESKQIKTMKIYCNGYNKYKKVKKP